MTIPTAPITVRATAADGSPIAGARVVAMLSRSEFYEGQTILPTKISGTTDAAGACVLNLWPNGFGERGTTYSVRVSATPAGGPLVMTISVPNTDAAEALDLLVGGAADGGSSPVTSPVLSVAGMAGNISLEMLSSAGIALTTATIAGLAEMRAVDGRQVQVFDGHRSGMFTCRAGDYSALIAADPARAVYVPSGDPGYCWVRDAGGVLHSNWWGAQSAYDAAAPIQQMLNLGAAIGGGVRCVVDPSLTTYNWREPQAVNTMMPSGTPSTGMLRIYEDCELVIERGARILNWRNYHGIVGPFAHRARVRVDGVIDFQAQAVDDLSAEAVAALPPSTYPHAVWSGYGTEAANLIYGTMTQYCGWPYGDPQIAGARAGVWFAGAQDAMVLGDGRIRRTRGASIRFSDNSLRGIVRDLTIERSRLNGVSFTSGSTGGLVMGAKFLDTLQVGISLYAPNDLDAGQCVAIGNRLINLLPLGENGIECVGTDGRLNPKGGAIIGNSIEGFAAAGIRVAWANGVGVNGNTIRRIRRNDIQRARYPGQSGGAGIRLQGPSLGGPVSSVNCAVNGNTIDDVDTWGINEAGTRNEIGANGIGDTCAFGRLLSESRRYVQFVTTLTTGALSLAAGFETVRVSATGTITSISAGVDVGQIVVLVKTSNPAGGDAPAGDLTISSSAVALAGGASSLTLSAYLSTLQIKWTGSSWVELRRAMNT